MHLLYLLLDQKHIANNGSGLPVILETVRIASGRQGSEAAMYGNAGMNTDGGIFLSMSSTGKKKSLFVYDNFSKLTQVLILKLLFVLAEVN